MAQPFATADNYFTEMCSGSEAGSYLRLIDFVYHSTLGLRVTKKKKKLRGRRRWMIVRSAVSVQVLGFRVCDGEIRGECGRW